MKWVPLMGGYAGCLPLILSEPVLDMVHETRSTLVECNFEFNHHRAGYRSLINQDLRKMPGETLGVGWAWPTLHVEVLRKSCMIIFLLSGGGV